MTIDLSQLTFEGDFAETELPDGSVLVLNKVSEDVPGDANTSAPVDCVNLMVITVSGEYVQHTNIVGMTGSAVTIESDYKELYGSRLTGDNMDKCYAVAIEEEEE